MLPPQVLANIVKLSIYQAPDTTSSLLVTSRDCFRSAASSMYHTLVVPNDEKCIQGCLAACAKSAPEEITKQVFVSAHGTALQPLLNALHQPSEYGACVRALTVKESFGGDYLTPLSSPTLRALLSAFKDIDALIWASQRPPPPDLCFVLSRVAPRLRFFAYRPSSAPSGRTSAAEARSGSSVQSYGNGRYFWDVSPDPALFPAGLGLFGPTSEDLRFDPVATSALGLNFVDQLEEDGEDDNNLNNMFSAMRIEDEIVPMCKSNSVGPLPSPIGTKPVDGMDASAPFQCFNLSSLSHITTLYVSDLSLDAAKSLTAALEQLEMLESVSFDFKFIEDSLLFRLAECCGPKRLKEVNLKSKGTKLSDKGVLALMHGCPKLRRLELSKMESRLTKKLWEKLQACIISKVLSDVSVVLDEAGPHHSWVSDHIDSFFNILKLGTIAHFATARLTTSESGSGPSFFHPMDEPLLPRLMNRLQVSLISHHAAPLITLNIDFFLISAESLKAILDGCQALEKLRAFLDCPFSSVMGISSAFAHLTKLHTVSFAFKKEHCPSPQLAPACPGSAQMPSEAGFRASGLVANDSPASTVATSANASNSISPSMSQSQSQMSFVTAATSMSNVSFEEFSFASPFDNEDAAAEEEPRQRFRSSSRTERSPVLELGHLRGRATSFTDVVPSVQELSLAQQSAPVQQHAPVTPDQHRILKERNDYGMQMLMPSKRDIRKLSRRCPSLRLLQWTGRNGLGDWLIDAAHNVTFIPASEALNTQNRPFDELSEEDLLERFTPIATRKSYRPEGAETDDEEMSNDDVEGVSAPSASSFDPFSPDSPVVRRPPKASAAMMRSATLDSVPSAPFPRTHDIGKDRSRAAGASPTLSRQRGSAGSVGHTAVAASSSSKVESPTRLSPISSASPARKIRYNASGAVVIGHAAGKKKRGPKATSSAKTSPTSPKSTGAK